MNLKKNHLLLHIYLCPREQIQEAHKHKEDRKLDAIVGVTYLPFRMLGEILSIFI